MTHDTLSQDPEIKLINQFISFWVNKTFVVIGAETGVFAETILKCGMIGVLFETMAKHLSVLQKFGSRYEGNMLHIRAEGAKQFFNVLTGTDDQELYCCLSLQKAGM